MSMNNTFLIIRKIQKHNSFSLLSDSEVPTSFTCLGGAKPVNELLKEMSISYTKLEYSVLKDNWSLVFNFLVLKLNKLIDYLNKV